ncbi:neuromast-expressed gpi-anchored lymphocyte antigen 6 [Halichoeres trimaculatus]|uniref:neuromast-expressed gpi-anchored lymphocyte antigen 6 n=1 Tax=Halichoeres trimaculatus TaxID=147232 RepID=UPI003D9E0556
MYFLTLVFGVALLSEAYTLKCHSCSPRPGEACNLEEVECPMGGQQCGTLSILSNAGIVQTTEVLTKSCFFPSECVEGSINFGLARTEMRSKCCSTDLCNDESFNATAIAPRPNGKKCYACTAPGHCTEILDCLGTEDHCVSSAMKVGDETLTMKGCASEQICVNPVSQITGSIDGGIDCCKGHLCNSASGAGAIFPLLLAPLFTSVMF